jgi:hypothetical protein
MRLLRLRKFFDDRAKFQEVNVAAFVFAEGVMPAEELAEAINEAMEGQDAKLRGAGDCLKANGRVIAVIHEKTVPKSVIFVDKVDNLSFIQAAREVTFLREYNGID